VNRKTILSVAVAAVALVAASSAHAADDGTFGEHGVMISADRLLPILNYDSLKTDTGGGGSRTDSGVSFAFGSNGLPGAGGTLYNLPRLGFDVVVVPHLTLGGQAWVYTDLSASESVTLPNGTTGSTDQPKTTYWGFVPRVGYVIPIGRSFAFWPRVGFEYHNLSQTSPSSATGTTTSGVWQVGMDVEAMFVITPWTRHFGITLGPTVDIPFAGKTSTTVTQGNVSTTTSVDSTMWQVGLQAGLVGHF
jgi:hypothetical protein